MSKEVEVKVNTRLDKERKVQELKEDLLSRLESMVLDDDQKKLVISVIDRVTQISERVGMANRVYLELDGDYSEHIRVTCQVNGMMRERNYICSLLSLWMMV